MKVALINPTPMDHYSPCIRTLSAWLKLHGHECRQIFLPADTYGNRFKGSHIMQMAPSMVSDLVELCEAALDGRLDRVTADWDPRAAVGVVLAAGGYPDTPRKGDPIAGLDEAAALPGKVFHAGTQLDAAGRVLTSGGRVLCAVGLGTTVADAQAAAYALTGQLCWEGMQYRRDIGWRAIAREQAARSTGGKTA